MHIIRRPRRSMSSAKTAMIGGSFDPVHLGHLFLLHCAVSMSDYSSFILIPAKVSNFKQSSRPQASDQDRLEMLRLAVEDYRDLYPEDRDVDISVSTMELERGGVSFTSDTIRILKEKLGLDRIGMVIGDDHLEGLSRWHDFEYLRDNVEFLICRRSQEGTNWDLIPEGVCYRRLEPENVAPQSSSAVRSDLQKNQDFLSRRVREYVKAKDLYD
ncbi:MAG TPA: nicotinate (nicotinamide) nucleotide adenylyltransferase [Sphaerochaeta sp.]|nr:nicotinate (nicotinamide) nucleotide adenylyltransferase [Sphaerochaeta sp.]